MTTARPQVPPRRWWQSLADHARAAIADLDELGATITTSLDLHVAPTVRSIAGGLDAAITRTTAGTTRDVDAITDRLRRGALVLDDGYQRFMVRRVDPLLGQTRSDYIDSLGGLEIGPEEVALNRRIALAGAALLALLVGRFAFPASLLITVPGSFLLALPVYTTAVRSVRQQRRVTYHVVSAINVTCVWLGGYYVPAIAATMVFYMGEKLLMITEDRSHRSLVEVFSQQPRTVRLLRGGAEVPTPLADVQPGDTVVVHAGGLMPVDGTVIAGLAAVDQQMLTGEAQPADKTVGDPVFASTVVLAGSLRVRVDKAGSETMSARLADILATTASYQLALQSQGNQMANATAIPTLALAGLALVTRGPESGLALLNSAFGVSIRVSAPITMLNLLNIAAASAMLIKDGRSLELLADVDTVVFDKTGTLTQARPNVARILQTSAADESQILAWAAAAERTQTHPIALAILAEAEARGVAPVAVDDARYEVGYGITVALGKRTIKVGSDRFMALEKIAIPPAIAAHQRASHTLGNSLVMVAVDGRLVGAIELQPTVRPEAVAVLRALRARGLAVMILSGDQDGPTRRLADQLGMDRHYADVLPEGKASLVAALQAEGRRVCFVGDGINDALALKTATVSVSLRGAATVATDAAQVVLMQESLQQLPRLFELGDDMARSMRLGNAASIIPGVLTVGGVFLYGWGYFTALGLSVASLATGLGIAMYPMYKYREQLADQAAARPRRAAASRIVDAVAVDITDTPHTPGKTLVAGT